MAITLTVGGQTVTLAVSAASVTLSTYIPGPPGVVGPPGPAGGAGFTLPTDSDIGGSRAVATSGGYAVYADSSDVSLPAIGISMGAVSAGDDVTVQSGSKLTVSGAGWTPGQPVYTSVNGLLTQTEPTTGFSQVLGVAHDATTLLIEVQKPVIRS